MFHNLGDITALFDGLFYPTYRTRLVRGGDEPLYLPAGGDVAWHRVIFAHGYYASALHEISHWCIAGERRRQLEDYGYWYLPDGRNVEQQQAFEAAEIAPQALESLFAAACGRHFTVSVDNLSDIEVDRNAFAAKVAKRAEAFELQGLPQRAEAFRTALAAFYRQRQSLQAAIALGRSSLDVKAATTY
ncbi:elongation factor P hydroxylase [Halomonas halocynthiae]|uniref:elongation factor P hydroxylase n=1 Tax=Halomonas halocynthiae TaxID=176290 RepID=UPI0004063902|nr:elongation factor P hydroxylase [Halomonas halocynthiae]